MIIYCTMPKTLVYFHGKIIFSKKVYSSLREYDLGVRQYECLEESYLFGSEYDLFIQEYDLFIESYLFAPKL